jgi:hypothetical protein
MKPTLPEKPLAASSVPWEDKQSEVTPREVVMGAINNNKGTQNIEAAAIALIHA